MRQHADMYIDLLTLIVIEQRGWQGLTASRLSKCCSRISEEIIQCQMLLMKEGKDTVRLLTLIDKNKSYFRVLFLSTL